MDVTLVLLSAGDSTRFNYSIKKQWIRIENDPLWLYVANRLNSFYNFKKTIITANENDVRLYEKLCDYEIVKGANNRQHSLKNAMEYVNSEYVMVSDVARPCIPKEVVINLINNPSDCTVPYLKPVDTIVYKNKTINRDEVKLIQTPQLSKTKLLKKALNSDKLFTDERALIESIGGKIKYILGSKKSKKITYFEDLDLPCLKRPSNNIFVGNGYDTHKFEKNKEMFLGGVKIDVNYGFKAHSDGDVAIHALIDALLGAAGLGDIGEFYPDTMEKYKGADSKELLLDTAKRIKELGYVIGNVDLSIIAQTPRLLNYKKAMRFKLANLLNLQPNLVNIKATTAEKLGWIGRKEGVAVEAVATLYYYDWTTNENYHN